MSGNTQPLAEIAMPASHWYMAESLKAGARMLAALAVGDEATADAYRRRSEACVNLAIGLREQGQ